MDRRQKYLVPYHQDQEKLIEFYSKMADTQSKAKALTKPVKQEKLNVQMVTPVAQIPVEAKELERDKKNAEAPEVYEPIKVRFQKPSVTSAQAADKATSKRKHSKPKKPKSSKKSKTDILN